MEKCGVLHFGSNTLRNGASYASDQYRILIENHTWRIERYHLQVPVATGIARNCIRNLSNLAVSICLKTVHPVACMSCYLKIYRAFCLFIFDSSMPFHEIWYSM